MYYPYFTDERIETRKLYAVLNINTTGKYWNWDSSLCMFDSQVIPLACPFSGEAHATDSSLDMFVGVWGRERNFPLHPRQRASIGSLGTVSAIQ